MSARHDRLAPLVAAYADGELPSDQAREVEQHVAQCVRCRRELRLQQAVRARLAKESALAVPMALRERIVRAVATASQGAARPRRRLWTWWMPVAGLAAAVATLVFAPWQSRPETLSRVSDSTAILGLIQAHATAWNRRDAKAAASVLSPDAVWVTSGGAEFHGRAEIERAHVQWFAEDSASVHVHPATSIAIRFLRPDVAIADLDGQFVVSGEVREQARIFVVATKNGGSWHIAQLRNIRRETHGSSPR